MTFNFTTQMTLHHLLPMPMNKNLSAKTTKYILKCRERSVKRSLISDLSELKNSHLLINILYMYMVKTFLKILWLQFLVPHSEHLLVSSATLLCKTQNILTSSLLVYYKGTSRKNFCHTCGFWLLRGWGRVWVNLLRKGNL